MIESSSLAVKYRPSNLSEFIGNEHVKETIQGFIQQERFPNSLLIHGSTGLGKTTLARIIARTLSCKTNDICLKCQSCKQSIDDHPDIKEVDVGGDRGIDTIRELKSIAKFAPMLGNMRVIIMDEVHALTSQGSSALLKVLEEPARSTMFILCTTDPHKILGTIKGRTKQLEVITPTFEEISKYLLSIAKKEGLTVTKSHKPVFEKIYEVSGGSVRNAVQLLETYIAMLNKGESDAENLLDALVGDNKDTLDIEDAAIETLYAVMTGDVKTIISYNRLDQRKLLMSVKYLIDQLVINASGLKMWSPTAFTFIKKYKSVLNIDRLLKIGLELTRLELQLNQGLNDMSIRYTLSIMSLQNKG
jgi:DNA polymerase-3 subunit gamma/tau